MRTVILQPTIEQQDSLKRKRSQTSANPSSTSTSDKVALRDIALSVIKAKRTVIVTGAGISCSSGIPVSRLYGSVGACVSMLKKQVIFAIQLTGLPLPRWSLQPNQIKTSQILLDRQRTLLRIRLQIPLDLFHIQHVYWKLFKGLQRRETNGYSPIHKDVEREKQTAEMLHAKRGWIGKESRNRSR